MAELKSAREWYETLDAGNDWDALSDLRKENEERYVKSIRLEAEKVAIEAVICKLSENGVAASICNDTGSAIVHAFNPPDPRREALGRKLYETLNPDGTAWDKHGESMHERYRAAAETVRDG